MSNSTSEYYENNAVDYAANTFSVDQSALCDRFLQYVKPGGRIVDCGCGSGRDLKYFKEHGLDCSGFDGSLELSRIASLNSGVDVACCTFENWIPDGRYDALWANASLLHLIEEDLISFMHKAEEALVSGGVICFTMKTGIEDGLDEKERYSRNFSEERLGQLLTEVPAFELIDKWISQDLMGRVGLKWMNVILKRRIEDRTQTMSKA